MNPVERTPRPSRTSEQLMQRTSPACTKSSPPARVELTRPCDRWPVAKFRSQRAR